MSLFELFLISVGLSMDAFAVAICIGLSMKEVVFKKMLVVGVYFGIFQAIMPLLGYLIGSQFANKITAFDHWIAFILLLIIGAKMIGESFKQEELQKQEVSLGVRKMLPLAIATSIDALAIGVSFAFLNVDIVPAVAFIGGITLSLSVLGVKLGKALGSRYERSSEILGGTILILLGLKILLEHLGYLSF